MPGRLDVWKHPLWSVGGSGTLQNGIKALVAAWAWMGHEISDSRGKFPSAQQRSKNCDRKIHKTFLSAKFAGSSEKLVRTSSNSAEGLVWSSPDGSQSEENCGRIYVFVGRRRRTKEVGTAVVEGISWRLPICWPLLWKEYPMPTIGDQRH